MIVFFLNLFLSIKFKKYSTKLIIIYLIILLIPCVFIESMWKDFAINNGYSPHWSILFGGFYGLICGLFILLFIKRKFF